ncbi:MAG: glycosyltransferase [Chloroflexi bacterium]|nr:glycosyltransferase [Chloroflexota bacterium]
MRTASTLIRRHTVLSHRHDLLHWTSIWKFPLLSIAVVIATHNRPELLAARSLASVSEQSRQPDYLVVVDDSDLELKPANAKALSDVDIRGTRVIYQENQRTPGASGAWNTALSCLYDLDPEAFVAVLDDDDSWERTYLEKCELAVLDGCLDMVAAGLVFHQSHDSEGDLLSPPESLDVSDLLVRNTHIQGSNLFVRLRKLLEAGLFDEALTSTTDRDICIRLADLGTVNFGPLNECLVHHFAEDDRPRLSSAGGNAKRAGLTHFYRKYRGRMSISQRAAFLDRCVRLFNCDPTVSVEISPPQMPSFPMGKSSSNLVIVAGAITSPDTDYTDRLLHFLERKIGVCENVTLKVVLLENGGPNEASREALRSPVGNARGRGTDVVFRTLEQQAADVAAGVFEASPEQLSGRKSIALSRTMLQHYLYQEAKPLPGVVVWILDDDVTLEGVLCGSDGKPQVADVDYVSAIRELMESGAGAVLCEVTGDPPLPALSCVRTQLVDLYHNLHLLCSLSPDTRWPDLSAENRLARRGSADYYYDLSGSGTSQLERPFWFAAEMETATAEETFREVVGQLPDILSGVQVFRPLVQDEPGGMGSSLLPSTNRGPATLVFDVQALRDFPNSVPSVNGVDLRRSDMVWSLLNRHVGGRDILQSRLPVRQARKASATAKMDFTTMGLDLLGFAVCSSLRDLLQQKSSQGQGSGKSLRGNELLLFTDSEVDDAIESCRKYLHQRLTAYELNFIRIAGLTSALKVFCQSIPSRYPRPWWLNSRDLSEDTARLGQFVIELESAFTDARLGEFKRCAGNFDFQVVRDFLRDLPQIVDRYRMNTPLPADQLRQVAEAHIRDEFGADNLTCLGLGEEGVALTDGKLVYKYFHYWKPGDREERIVFLQSLVGKLSGFRTLPDLLEVRRRGEQVVAVYPYEAGNKYEGGQLEEMLTLLREAREAGIACRNIHPDNLLTTSSGLKLIDYGSDIVPCDNDEFDHMCRRAFLSYRFHFRSDLKSLMARALTDYNLPELVGFDHFRRALAPRSLDELYYEPMAELIAGERPEAVLDYGCGDGRLSEKLAALGITVSGYDPDPDCIARCLEKPGSTLYGGAELLERLLDEDAKFDIVACGRVMCTIADDAEFRRVLEDLRRLVAESGKVLISVCNPLHLSTDATELWTRHLPPHSRYENTFVYEKTVVSSGQLRSEVHRSVARYRSAFAAAGFRIDEVVELDGTDTGNLLPASDHLVFRLVPQPVPKYKVSLLIKTCLMEWRIIERLVRHLVRQLETPTRFYQKVIVVDPSEGPFLRQHDYVDAEAHSRAMDRLLADGVVDQVVYAADDPDVIRATYLKWFGYESTETHAVGGQQLFATLFGFDSCSGDYVLQVDSDLLIARNDADHDYLSEMVDVLRGDHRALFASLSICGSAFRPYSHEGPNGNWRVEVRVCLFDRERVQSVLPVANNLEQCRFNLAWHRAFDRFIAETEYRSYRGGNPRTAFIHVPNARKTDVDGWHEVIASVERGHVSASQAGRVELAGTAWDWAGPKREEPVVFVICGRNVEPARFKRCFESLVAQSNGDWGAVVVDDASTNGFGDYAEVLLSELRERVTLVHNPQRRGGLYNTWNAVANFCANPDSVIITLDADDALIGERVVDRVLEEYAGGADATVGSMLRLDKEGHYPVKFDNPRWWDSNVWQHLRSFRKRLFDAIDVADFKVNGEWVDLATDWAFMVPIIEMASSPRHIREDLYLYEPARPKDDQGRRERASVIAQILAKQPYPRLTQRG